MVTAALATAAYGCASAGKVRPVQEMTADPRAIELSPVEEFGPGMILDTGNGALGTSLGDVSAVAARAGALYVVDRQQGLVIRVDMTLRDAKVLATLRIPDTRGLFVSEDGIVYVVDRYERSVRQVDEYGFNEQVFADVRYLADPIDVAVVEPGGFVVIADELENQLVVFNQLGAVTSVLGDRFRSTVLTQSVNAIAATSRGVVVVDPAMSEALEVDLSGRLLASYGEVDLRQPIAAAVDVCGRVYVLDQAGLFTTGPAAKTEPARHLLPPGFRDAATDLWVDNNVLYVAAGVYGVRSYSVNPPCVGTLP